MSIKIIKINNRTGKYTFQEYNKKKENTYILIRNSCTNNNLQCCAISDKVTNGYRI